MTVITKEEAQFIDTYLKNSGVHYHDIRFEMADHIASALESMDGDFMENFTAYMINHKSELLQNNRQFAKHAAHRAWKMLCKNLISPAFIVLFLLVTWGFSALTNIMDLEDAKRIMYYPSSTIIIMVFCHHFYNIAFAKVRFSVSEKLLSFISIFFYWLTMIIKPQNLIENPVGISVYYAFIISLLSAVYYTYIVLVKRYKLQFIK